MAYELYTRTNQKLYFAGLALEALSRAEAGGGMNAQGMLQAEREAAIFHLYGSLLSLCHEIAGYYRLPNANTSRAEQLLDPVLLENHAIPELGELIELAQQRETWLGQLLQAYNALFLPPVAPLKPKGDVLQPLIQAVSLDEPVDEPLGRETLQDWRQQLKLLAIRYREGLSEC